MIDAKDSMVLITKMNFFDMPGSEIMLDDPETLRVRQGTTLNKAISCVCSLIKDLSSKRTDFVFYESSTVTHLLKEGLGGNSMTVGIFCL